MALYFSESFLREVMDRNDIESVISRYVQLKRTGSSLKGLCPFHKEKTPSFSVSPDKQLYHCFGCGKSGTVINFIMDMENLDFVEAVKLLAERSGIPIPENNERSSDSSQARATVYKINKIAARYFYDCLNSPLGQEANEYIVRRGLTSATLTRFGIGYAPKGDEIIKLMYDNGFSDEEILASGIVGKDENGRMYPRFRNRLMFPIIDVRKNIIGFGGRVLDDSKPKYLNSPDTVAFNKSYNLYGLNMAKNSKTGYFILVEGYMDVISLHQYGINSAVATLGTALTPEQARIMKRMRNEVIISYDSDEAGQKATKRAIEILTDEDVNVRVVTIPGSKDPDEFIKSRGSGAFNDLVSKAQVQIEYKMSKLREIYDLHDTTDKINYVNAVASELIKLKSPVEREIYVNKISEETGVSAQSITAETERMLAILQNKKKFDNFKPEPSVKTEKFKNSLSKYDEAQSLLLNIICYKGKENREILSNLESNDFSEGIKRKLFDILRNDIQNGVTPDPRMIVLKYSDTPEAAEILHDDKNVEDYHLAAEQCKSIIKQFIKKQKMKDALKSGGIEKLAEIYKGEHNEQ